jgi:hypothetical protein
MADENKTGGLKGLIEGLTIFLKYDTEESWSPTHCEHDIFMVCAASTKEVSPEDAKRLDELGFFWSDESECWCSFRYGSA